MPYSILDPNNPQQPSPPESPPPQREDDALGPYGPFKPKVIKHCARLNLPLSLAYFVIGVLQAIFFWEVYAFQQWVSSVWMLVTAFFTYRSLKRRSRGNFKLVLILSIISFGLAVMCIAVSLEFLATYTNPDINHGPNMIINFVLFCVICIVSLMTVGISLLPAMAAGWHLRKHKPMDVPGQLPVRA